MAAPPGSEPRLLDIRGLKTHFRTDEGWLHAVDGVDISVGRGETVSVVGESGCGKTVTAMSVLKLIPMPPGKIVAGQILWQGRDLVPLDADAMRSIRGQGNRDRVPGADDLAQPGLHDRRTDRRGAPAAREACRRRAALDRAVEMLKLVHISDAGAARARLSAPVFRRHAPAGDDRDGALCNPKLLIADEPTTALDVTIQAQILDLLGELQARLGMAVMLITHEMGVVAETAQRVVVMYAGKVIEEAPVRRLFADPRHPVHAGADPLDSAHRHAPRSQGAAGGDPGRRAEPARPAARLPLRAALPLRDARLHGGDAAAASRSRRGHKVACILDDGAEPP